MLFINCFFCLYLLQRANYFLAKEGIPYKVYGVILFISSALFLYIIVRG